MILIPQSWSDLRKEIALVFFHIGIKMGNTCVGHGCCNPNRNGSGNRKPMDKPFTDPSPGENITFDLEYWKQNYLSYAKCQMALHILFMFSVK